MRLDLKLLSDNKFESRTKAQNAIKSGNIYVNGKKTTQSSIDVSESDIITIKGSTLKFVSKGGLKLEKIIKNAHINMRDKIMVDVGASTGGFTDCALKYGAKKVYAIDTGTNQLHPSLRDNPSVICYENTDFRTIENGLISDANIATVDVSFISSLKMIDKFVSLDNISEILLLIKPQFECGKSIADRYKGVIINKDIHCNVLTNVISEYDKSGYKCNYLTFSPIRNPNGNIEYIGYFSKNETQYSYNIKNIVNDAFKALIKSK